jgi:hypothetical protein
MSAGRNLGVGLLEIRVWAEAWGILSARNCQGNVSGQTESSGGHAGTGWAEGGGVRGRGVRGRGEAGRNLGVELPESRILEDD